MLQKKTNKGYILNQYRKSKPLIKQSSLKNIFYSSKATAKILERSVCFFSYRKLTVCSNPTWNRDRMSNTNGFPPGWYVVYMVDAVCNKSYSYHVCLTTLASKVVVRNGYILAIFCVSNKLKCLYSICCTQQRNTRKMPA